MILHYALVKSKSHERRDCPFNGTDIELSLLYQLYISSWQIIFSLLYQGRTWTSKEFNDNKEIKRSMSMALVVDDELDICLMVTKHLQNLHFETQYALTVKAARLKVSSTKFGIIFVDLNLTDGSGFEIINYIRELNLDSKIIVISAYDSEANKALAMGADLFVSKPFTTKVINAALTTLNFLPQQFI